MFSNRKQPADMKPKVISAKSLPSGLKERKIPLIFSSTSLRVRTGFRGDFFGEEPFDGAVRTNSVQASLISRATNYFILSNNGAVGIEEVNCQIHEGESNRCVVGVWPIDDHIERNTLNFGIVLQAEKFREVFHPIWIRQSKSKLHITIAMLALQDEMEATFLDLTPVQSIFLKESGDRDATLTELGIETDIQ